MLRQIKGSAVYRLALGNHVNLSLLVGYLDVSVPHGTVPPNCRVTGITRLCSPYAGVSISGAWLVLVTIVSGSGLPRE
jgi:hypothetical protein